MDEVIYLPHSVDHSFPQTRVGKDLVDKRTPVDTHKDGHTRNRTNPQGPGLCGRLQC